MSDTTPPVGPTPPSPNPYAPPDPAAVQPVSGHDNPTPPNAGGGSPVTPPSTPGSPVPSYPPADTTGPHPAPYGPEEWASPAGARSTTAAHAPGPLPSHAFGVPPTDMPSKLRPLMSTTAGIVVIGVLSLIGASMFLAGVLLGSNGGVVAWGRLFILGVGLGVLVLGGALAATALRGKRGGWLTIVSSLVAAFLVPSAIFTGAFVADMNRSGSDYGSSTGWATEPSDGGQERTYVEDGQQSFGFDDNSIIAIRSDVEIDLTEANPDHYGYIDVDLTEGSTLTVIMTPDQSLSIDVGGTYDMTYAIEVSPETEDAYPWLVLLKTLNSRSYIESDAYLQTYTGITLYIMGSSSNVVFHVVDTAEEPQS